MVICTVTSLRSLLRGTFLAEPVSRYSVGGKTSAM